MAATNQWADATHCPRGHEYGGDNLLAHGKSRECRECKNLRRREQRAEAREKETQRRGHLQYAAMELERLRARLRAFGVDCVLNGDMTPMGQRMLNRILEGEQ